MTGRGAVGGRVAAEAVGGARPRGTPLQRIRAGLVAGGSWVASRLPEPAAVRLAESIGSAWYRLAPARAAQARRNLGRVVTWLAAEGLGGEAARRAATDPAALEALVRSAFRHAARYYLEVARTPGLTPAIVREQLLVETPEVVEQALGPGQAVIIVGLHFGAIELPGLYLSLRTGRPTTAPMETVGDPELQRYFVRTRSRLGARIVGLREARRELTAAIARGESVGLVGDRDITGGGLEVSLFGASTRLPIGPALLAVETGAPIYVAAVRRVGVGCYRGGLHHVRVPAEGTRRERMTGALTGIAAAFERAIADAPDQWWTVFFPIWPDLEAGATTEGGQEAAA